jgi:chromosome segregation ATPase
MFDLFSKKKSVDELLQENKNLEDILKSIEEDGTHEHNNAIKLRQENVELLDKIRQLEVAIERWHSRSKEWEKAEADLIDRVNEIDSDVNRDLTDEVFCLKNDYAVLRANHQIVQNNYKKCTEQRDEFKHQLNAANKEIEILKKDIQDYIFEKSDEYNTLKALYERAKKVVEGVEVDLDKPLDEQSDKEPQKHPMYPLHWGGYDKEVEFQGEWKCPCNVCKEDNTSEDKVTSDLALRVTRLESQIKNLTSSCRDI